MATATHLLTYEDLRDTPEDLNRYEIVNGSLVASPAPPPVHALISIALVRLLGGWVWPRNLGTMLTAPVDVRLAPHQIFEPDLLFIRRERLGIIGEALIEGAPDLVVEILSPSSRGRDLGEKAEIYAEGGVPEYWIVDPDARGITLFALRAGRYEPLPEVDGAIASAVLPGLVVVPAAIFAEL